MTLPLYTGAAAAIPADRRRGNAGLHFQRLFDGYDGDWGIGETKKNWLQGFAGPVGNADALERLALAQATLAEALGGRTAVFHAYGRFVTGTGYPHPVENGLAWHPVLGVPYLAGSAVKGLLRAWIEQWVYESDEDEARRAHLLAWFGSDNKNPEHQLAEPGCGDLICFDAIPVAPVPLEVDIMTPHMGKWYEQGGDIRDPLRQPERLPADWHDPTPIPFLVAKRIDLLFTLAPRNAQAASRTDLQSVMDNLGDALEWMGAGAKTAIGYGQMAPNTNAEQKLRASLEAAVKAELEAGMSPEELRIQTLTDLLEKDKAANRKEPGGPLMQQLASLLKEATAWSAEDRERLAELAEAAYGYTGWGKSKKRQRRRQDVADLRTGKPS